jgi:hypothetical protein
MENVENLVTVVTPLGRVIDHIDVSGKTLGDLKSVITNLTDVDRPMLVVERLDESPLIVPGERAIKNPDPKTSFFHITQRDSTLVSALDIGNSPIILHSPNSLFSTKTPVFDDSKRYIPWNASLDRGLSRLEEKVEKFQKEKTGSVPSALTFTDVKILENDNNDTSFGKKPGFSTTPIQRTTCEPEGKDSKLEKIFLTAMGVAWKYKELVKEGMREYEAALKRQDNSAVIRAILCICKLQSGNPNNGIDDPFASALFDNANNNSEALSPEEVSVLFVLLKKKFEGEDSLSIYVDYHPSPGPVTDTLSEGFKLIRENREYTAKCTGKKFKKLPLGIGIPCKSIVSAKKGCAMFDSSVIDEFGNPMDVNPHEIAYETMKIDDIKRALNLQPERPFDLQRKFENKKIVQAMGYTLEKNAVQMFEQGNLGIGGFLLEGIEYVIDDPEAQDICYKILNVLYGWRGASDYNGSIAMYLFESGLAPFDPREKVWYDSPFFVMIKRLENSNLENLLEIVIKKREKRPFHFYNGKHEPSPEFKKIFCSVVAHRLCENKYSSRLFRLLRTFWASLHLEKSQRLYSTPHEFLEQWRIEFCNGIVEAVSEKSLELPNKFKEELTAHLEKPSGSVQLEAVKQNGGAIQYIKNFEI